MDFGTRTVLVTGATGWLGLNLVHALAHGLADVDRLKRPQPGLKIRCLVLPGAETSRLEAVSDRVEVVPGDVRSLKDCRRFCAGAAGAVLFHTAGIIHPKRVSEFYRVNVQGTADLLDAAAESGVRRAVVASSNSPCGCNPHPDHRFDEASPYRPYMNYGRSKMLMEQTVLDTGRLGRIETVVVRPPWFYGPHQPPRQSLFFQMIRAGKFPQVGPGDNLRSMVYIDNLCQGFLLAALVDPAAGETYWIADRRPYSMTEIVETTRRVLESELRVQCSPGRVRLPSVVGRIAWFADAAIQGVGLYHPKVHVLSEMGRSIACSVAKARRELGYEPTVELEEGMTRSVRWVVRNGMTI